MSEPTSLSEEALLHQWASRGRSRRWKRWLLPAIVVALVATACSGGGTHVETSSPVSVAQTTAPSVTATLATTTVATTEVPESTTTLAVTTTSVAEATSAEPLPFTWNLIAGGDVLMDRSEAAGINPFGAVTPALDTATISMVNIEMAISDTGSAVPGKEFTFRAPSSAADTIAAAGIDVVTLGNNHARDFGSNALTDTIELLTERGIVVVGAGSTDTEAFTPRVIRVGDGIDVAFIGAALIVPGGFAASPGRAGVADGNDRNRVIANVRVAATRFDVVIVTLHWGTERATCPSKTHRRFADQLLEAGATAVIGHHPHVLQPIEFDEGKVAVFSLGNFVWHPRKTITADTGVVELVFEEDELINVMFHPHSLDDAGSPAPVSEGFRFDRIVDIVGGDCAKHQPPPLPPTTSSTTLVDGDTTTSTVASSTSVPPESTTTTASTSPPSTTTTSSSTTTTSSP